jgi:hypothetical protein
MSVSTNLTGVTALRIARVLPDIDRSGEGRIQPVDAGLWA